VWRNYLPNNPVSDKLGRILDKMTHSMVKQRYQSASEVMQDLEISEATSVDVVALSPTVQTPLKLQIKTFP
jgi:uncharacterized protein YqeY